MSRNGQPKSASHPRIAWISDDQDVRKCCHDNVESTLPFTEDDLAIPISGVKRIFGQSVTFRERVMWISILCICMLLTIRQIYDRVSYYTSTPVTANSRTIRNKSLEFPSVTFCNRNKFNVTSIEVMYRNLPNTTRKEVQLNSVNFSIGLLLHGNETSVSLWRRISHNLEKMINECWFGRGLKCPKVGRWSPILTVGGVCYQFVRDNPIFTSGQFNNLYLRLVDDEVIKYKNLSGFDIHIHDHKCDPILDMWIHGTRVTEKWGKNFRIQASKFKVISRRNLVCDNNPDYCQSNCFTSCFIRTFFNVTGCYLPYMGDYIETSLYCNNLKEYVKAEEVEHQLLFLGGWNPSECNCKVECHETIYQIFTEVSQSNYIGTRIRVFFQELTYDEVTEELAYDTISLLCDIGGTLGLLLGASVLTLIETLEIVTSKLYRTIRLIIRRQRLSRIKEMSKF